MFVSHEDPIAGMVQSMLWITEFASMMQALLAGFQLAFNPVPQAVLTI